MNKINTIFISALTCIFTATPAISNASIPMDSDNQYVLMLAGGSLSVCSSSNTKHCNKKTKFSSNAKSATLYEINRQSLARLTATEAWKQLNNNTAKTIEARLSGNNNQTIGADGLDTLLGEAGKALSDKSYFALLDNLELAQVLPNGERKKEQISLADNRSSHSAKHFQSFVTRAGEISGKTLPKIGVITASARDPFEAADFYTQVFNQAGGEAIWIPLDGALQQAWGENVTSSIDTKPTNRCNKLAEFGEAVHGYYDRARIYPELTVQQQALCRNRASLSETLNTLDGLFLSGGDQTLTLSAWLDAKGKPSPELALIKARFNRGELVIGGTSAGAAVMASEAMITGGTSEGAIEHGVVAAPAVSERCETQACDAALPANILTYRVDGGLGIYPFGITDTHFSQRSRQLRLMLLQEKSQSGVAVGVDENTALWLSKDGQKAVVEGEHGVWFIEPAEHTTLDGQFELTHRVFYLGAGSHLNLSAQKVMPIAYPVDMEPKRKDKSEQKSGENAQIQGLAQSAAEAESNIQRSRTDFSREHCTTLNPSWLLNSGATLKLLTESRCSEAGFYQALALVHRPKTTHATKHNQTNRATKEH